MAKNINAGKVGDTGSKSPNQPEEKIVDSTRPLLQSTVDKADILPPTEQGVKNAMDFMARKSGDDLSWLLNDPVEKSVDDDDKERDTAGSENGRWVDPDFKLLPKESALQVDGSIPLLKETTTINTPDTLNMEPTPDNILQMLKTGHIFAANQLMGRSEQAIDESDPTFIQSVIDGAMLAAYEGRPKSVALFKKQYQAHLKGVDLEAEGIRGSMDFMNGKTDNTSWLSD